MKIIEINAMTGERKERELTAEEIAEMEAMQTEVPTEPQSTLEQRVTEIEQVTTEVFEQLNDKGLI